jgi:L-lactate utilization protein LutC
MTSNTATIERLPLDESFAVLATTDSLQRAADSLRSHGFEVEVVADGAAARDLVLSRIALGSEVHGGASATIDSIGLTEVLERSGDYLPLRPRIWAMDRQTQKDSIRKLGAAPDVFVNSAHAVTEDGSILIASATGSQLGPIASGAGHIYFVVGAQKVVPDVATALRRIETYVFPLEDARAQEAYGMHSALNKVLIVNGDFPGRVTVVLVEESIGF